jgi:hypothetical protein
VKRKKLEYVLDIDGNLTTFDSFLWRVGRDEPLRKVYISSANGCSVGYGLDEIYLLDNLYIDYTGVNLDGAPASETWAGYTIREDGWADTGTFLGWVSPLGDWLFVQSLGAYIYMPENWVGATGGWMFKVAFSPVESDTAETWAGYASVDGNWYNTGALFGWIAPKGDWIYTQSLGKYLYAPESLVLPFGAWGFVSR